MTLEDYLRQHAEAAPDAVALVCGDRRLTYGELLAEAVSRSATLSGFEGRAVVLRAEPTADFVANYFAVHLAGKVAVPLPKDATDEDVVQCFDRCSAAQLPDNAADVLFTTGTTGKQKGVVVSHQAIVADAENLIAAQGYHRGLTTVVNGPLNHIGSLSKIFPTIAAGGTVSIVDGMKDIDAFFRAVDAAEGRAATFLVPSAIRMLLTFAGDKLAAHCDKIELIETGAAPIAKVDMERLHELLPQTRLYNTYASTETGIIATFDYAAGGCLEGCLGRPMRHSSVAIAADGHIICGGRTLMSGYLGDAKLTAGVLRDGEVHTSDLGFIDVDGRLWLEGRQGDVINVGGYKISPEEVESAALTLPTVADCVCVAGTHRVLGTQLKLLVVTADGHEFDKKAIARALAAKLERHKVPLLYESIKAVRRNENGKIDRKSYN